jgi:hypothetical protein
MSLAGIRTRQSWSAHNECRNSNCRAPTGGTPRIPSAATRRRKRLRGQLAADHHKPWNFGEGGLLLLGFRCRLFLGEHDFLERHQRELDHPLMHDRPLRPLPHRHRADSNAESLSEGRLAQAERFPAGLELFGSQMITITRS